jgi:hypothetical protein
VFAILSNIEMYKRFHKKDNECDEGNYNKNGFHSYLVYMSKIVLLNDECATTQFRGIG